ncbi:MAG: hypothetical protein J4F28_09155 [Nitrosopumilaceae archaeon]|nr:hypothetical protein [Nitrosopumilaceae archaeon]
MVRTSIITDKLRMEGQEFVTAGELKKHCAALGLDYGRAVHYLTKMRYLLRVFRGIFYVVPLEESRIGALGRYNQLELVARGLGLKGVENWYFGLHTALKLNNMTHEYYVVDEVISDTLFRANPVMIAGGRFRFVKLAPKLLGFGVRREGPYRYSDPEKTILDFVYLWSYRGVPAGRIVMDVADWAGEASADRIAEYSVHYPETVARIAAEVVPG